MAFFSDTVGSPDYGPKKRSRRLTSAPVASSGRCKTVKTKRCHCVWAFDFSR